MSFVSGMNRNQSKVSIVVFPAQKCNGPPLQNSQSVDPSFELFSSIGQRGKKLVPGLLSMIKHVRGRVIA